jgi:prepilin-type processing-associated H-X9-DG protein
MVELTAMRHAMLETAAPERAPRSRGARRGLSIVEVVVAVSVVLLLLALLLPALGRSRGHARSVECQGNLRQLAVAARTYAEIHRERYPAAILRFATPAGLRTECWDFTHHPDGRVTAGALRGLTDRPEQVQQCPCCLSHSTFGDDPATGYNYNTSFIGAEGHWPIHDASGQLLHGWSHARAGLPVTLHRRPDSTALLGDGGWSGGANKFMRAPMNRVEFNWGLVYAGGQAFRHGGAANIAWLDGHVSAESAKFEGPQASSALVQQVLGFPENAFLSPDDSRYDPR